MSRKTILALCAGAAASLFMGAAMAQSNFDTDVNTAINRGLAYLDGAGAYIGYGTGSAPTCQSPSDMTRVRGLALLALLEKRKSGNLNDPPQGYAGASDADKTKMRKAVSCILRDMISDPNRGGDVAYADGNWLMGLSLYARTGGLGKGVADIPDVPALMDLYVAIDTLTDRLLNAQCSATYGTASYRGMWYYSGCGDDSSTTQFAAAGLAGAKGYYLWKNQDPNDPTTRLAKVNAALALAGAHYATYGYTGSDNSSCGVVDAIERGHGYHNGYNPSLQQTSSGLWVQMLGGGKTNDAGVQAYLRWLRNHYRWQDLDSMGNSWPYYSYWYYMWSSMKALLTLKDSDAPTAGNVGPNDVGTLAADGTCSVRQLHKDPASTSRPASYGTGNYAGATASTYFDYATSIMGYDCGDGQFECNSAPGSWEPTWGTTSWALLVLQRATGGACVDSNNDGQCDGDQNAPSTYAPCDVNGDGTVTMDDVWAMLARAQARTAVTGSSSASDQAANAVTFFGTTQAQPWTAYTGDQEINIADFTRCIFAAYGR